MSVHIQTAPPKTQVIREVFSALIHGEKREIHVLAADRDRVLYHATPTGLPTIHNCCMSPAGFKARFPEALLGWVS